MSTLLTYALNNEKQLVHIDSVANGNKCKCVCPHCGKPLQARNHGKSREHHFAHMKGCACESAFETALHMLAKQIIVEEKIIMLPVTEKSDFPNGKIRLNNVRSEVWDEQYKFRPDVEGVTEKGERILIEILVSHKITPTKREVILSNHLKCLEINLNYIELDKKVIREFLLNSCEDRSWVVPLEKKPLGHGGLSLSGRNPNQLKAIELLKRRFDDGDLNITINGCTYNLSKLGYDVCEPISNSFRGFKSDLLLYRSQKENKGYISLNVRGRRRNFNQRIPSHLRVIDVFITDNMECSWLKNSPLDAYGFQFEFKGFKHQ